MRDTEKNMEENLLLPSKERSEEEKVNVYDFPLTTRDLLFEEVKRLSVLAGPLVAVTLSQYLLQVISLMMVGHLGELALSSTAITISLSSVTGFSLLVSNANPIKLHFPLLIDLDMGQDFVPSEEIKWKGKSWDYC